MKEYKITLEQIQSLLECGFELKNKLLRQWYPSVFLEFDEWYWVRGNSNSTNNALVYIQEDKQWTFAFGHADIYTNEYGNERLLTERFDQIIRKATQEEVEDRFILEAKERGFVPGAKFISITGGEEGKIREYLPYEDHSDIKLKISNVSGKQMLYCSNGAKHYEGVCSNPRIFIDGKWAEVIEEPSKEITMQEIADKFGIDVSDLKIKK